jgi:hypothetical protein
VQAQVLGSVVSGRPSAVAVTSDLLEGGRVDLTLSSDAGPLTVSGPEPGVACSGSAPLQCLVPARSDGRAQLIVLVPPGAGPAWFDASAVPEGSTGPASTTRLVLDPGPSGLSADYAATDGTIVTTTSASVARCRDEGSNGCVPDTPLDRGDVDDDPATSTSADAELALPSGAVVRWARLYWAADPAAGADGDAAPDAHRLDQVQVTVPSGDRYLLGADRLDLDHGAYQASADVTGLVAEGGTFRVADIQMGTGRNRWGSWTLAVAYEGVVPPVSGPPTVVFSGLTRMAPGTSASARYGGPDLLAPAAWADELVAYEGDTDLADDRTSILGSEVVDLFDSWSTGPDRSPVFGAGLDHDGRRAFTSDPGAVAVVTGHDAVYLGLLVVQAG